MKQDGSGTTAGPSSKRRPYAPTCNSTLIRARLRFVALARSTIGEPALDRAAALDALTKLERELAISPSQGESIEQKTKFLKETDAQYLFRRRQWGSERARSHAILTA